MKVFMFFINLIFWLWAFIVPAGICSFFGWLIYIRSHSNLPFSILMSCTGIAVGIWLAETIRRKYGLSHFFSRIMASPDLDPREEAEKEDKAR
jgi:hypothetical protein